MDKEWFASWFDSPYYHVLYKDRDEAEAFNFIEKLDALLDLPKKAEVLDLACGKGRHSIILHKMGYVVTGADLSCASIREAQKSQEKGLEFIVHDMRERIEGKEFHAIFNLFTSFGYFEQPTDNIRVVHSVHEMLHEGGLFILDFMNAEKVLRELVAEERKICDGIEFIIRKRQDGVFIVKEIEFEAEGQSHHYTERVRILQEEDFDQLLGNHGFRVIAKFGNFQLSPFDPVQSERLIIIAQKI